LLRGQRPTAWKGPNSQLVDPFFLAHQGHSGTYILVIDLLQVHVILNNNGQTSNTQACFFKNNNTTVIKGLGNLSQVG
jgi:hypothetical protein